MMKEKILKVVTATTCIASLILPHTSAVLAAALTNQVPNEVNTIKLISHRYHEGGDESSESLSEEGERKYDRETYKYSFGGENSGTPILKIVREDDRDPTRGFYLYSDAFYCLNGEKSFPSLDGALEYTRTVSDFFEENPETLHLSDENYNSLCWILDNMYLRKQMTPEQRAVQKDTLMRNAFKDLLNAGYEDSTDVDGLKSVITDDDIEVVQQWAIWYFANPNKETMQHIKIEQDKLPVIDLTTAMGTSPDSMADKDLARYEWLTILYRYFVNQALENKDHEMTTSTSKYPTIANRDVTYEIDGSDYKVGPFKVTAPSDNLSSSDYQITLTDGTSELLSTAYTIKDANGDVIHKKLNEIFDTDYYIYLPANGNKVQNLKLNLSYTKFGTKASVWTAGDNDYQPVVLITKEGDTVTDSVSAEINPIYDLALRKYIVAINGNEIKDRTPNADISGLQDGSSETAEYKHKKNALEVSVGDTITYRMAIYNEGNVDAKATGIVDYLPTGLEVIRDNEINQNYAWDVSEDGTIVTTTITKDTIIPAFNNDLKGIYVDLVCQVTDKATSGAILTNIAEIQSDDIDDRDSDPDSWKDKINSIDQSSYTGKDNKSDLSDSEYFYKGQQDDDDFEKVIVAGKAFDLSLQKFITKLNGEKIAESREPKVDTTPLKNGLTNATYTQVKTPVLVQKGDIVTYTIRIYNEGEVDGYAQSVADYLPDGLGFLVNYQGNIDNCWALPNDGSGTDIVSLKSISNKDYSQILNTNQDISVAKGNVKLTSTALSSNIDKNQNLIKAFDGSNALDYRDIEVTCVVLADSNLKNIAEITEDADKDENDVVDRDSTPDTVNPDNYPGDDENQDDNDYEILTMKKFDLALQKFITGLNDKKITDRVPKVSYNNGKISYEHPQTPLEVNNGDNVTYTIRVYNEGEVDGYAAEIGDDIPNGLVFDSENEINKKYGWVMYDANKNVTTDSSKAVEIRTDYLSKEKAEARGESALLTAFDPESGNLFYLDVQAVFKVNAKSSNDTITNTAEITKDTDSDGNEIEDIDSTPDNKKDGEDDIDKERVHVGYFDLALQKDLVKAVVTEGSSTNEIMAENGKLTKVEINRKKINSTIVKFVYNVTITNEGTIPGYAKEIRDYIPEGLEFVEADNQNWKEDSNGTIVTDALANTLLQPGQTASVEVTLRWINNENNMGLKTNVAEISKDYNEAGDVDDIDSTPDNKKDGEDDIDDAPVILSISTGKAPMYIVLTTAVLAMVGTGVVAIKKYIL